MMNKKKFITLIIVAGMLGITGCRNEESMEDIQVITAEQLDEKQEEIVESITEEVATEEATEEVTEEQIEELVSQPVVMEELQQTLLDYVQQQTEVGNTTSFYVEELSSGDYVNLSLGKMKSASLIKLYVAGCIYENMEEMMSVESYVGETEALIQSMLTISDNEATNLLVTRLGADDANIGMQRVNEFCQFHGYTETAMGRLMLDFSSTEDNYTSVKDCGMFLKAIYNNQLIGSENILGYLKQQERTTKIPAGIPTGYVVANKTGELENVENDVAIIFTENSAYIMCVMTGDLAIPGSARDMIVMASGDVFQYIMNHY